MASLYNYTFDNLSRVGDDACYLSERTKQNTAYGSYNVTNFFLKDCAGDKALNFATQQPNVFVSNGHGLSGTCNIDNDSKMRIGTIQTNPKARISLYTRPFATAPYLGNGSHTPVEESRLQQGEFITNRKSVNTVTETSYEEYKNYPLIPSLRATITNPNNLVEGAANEGWVRGGLPSRDLIRDQDYMQRKM